jgi:hypothetical protein
MRLFQRPAAGILKLCSLEERLERCFENHQNSEEDGLKNCLGVRQLGH